MLFRRCAKMTQRALFACLERIVSPLWRSRRAYFLGALAAFSGIGGGSLIATPMPQRGHICDLRR